ncbi:helix-hairpin-helix domain-containing protein [Levilactobacillus spicheri]|uniref:DNA-binding protein n=1 Tax=Levilactobacillus spicheri TaxID=216463 RepID=A0A0F3RQG8_9LACO|nr:helix-hairpin-helix domain-containing protein [Levilactobacillus spicheri]KJW12246.1 DNA-binding protein [Levilactobacillus spicheri]
MDRIGDWWQGLTRKMQLVGVLVGAGILLLGGWWLRPQPTALPPATPPPVSQGAHASTATSTKAAHQAATKTKIYVDVQGAVHQPGLYAFQPGMRVADALRVAGGLLSRADRRQVNLAAQLTDQQQLVIPAKGEKESAPAPTSPASVGSSRGASSAAASAGTPINLNTATLTDLQQLTGIGAKKAQKIIDYRTEHGDFKSVRDLTQVAGFGEKTVARLEPQLTVG